MILLYFLLNQFLFSNNTQLPETIAFRNKFWLICDKQQLKVLLGYRLRG